MMSAIGLGAKQGEMYLRWQVIRRSHLGRPSKPKVPHFRQLQTGMTFAEIGWRLGISRSRVQQIYGAAIRKLRRQPEAQALAQALFGLPGERQRRHQTGNCRVLGDRDAL